jgi:transposase-like protein
MERAHHRYSPELKGRLVADIENGHLSVREAARDAQTSVTMIQKWLEEYGRYKPKRDVVEVVMKSEQERISALEQALAEAHLKLRVYDELITQANKHFKTDLKKSFGTPPRPHAAGERLPSTSERSAPRSAARETPTTNAPGERARRSTGKSTRKR